MNRRNFITGMAGILASGFAPAVIGSGVLMPVRKIFVPPPLSINMIPRTVISIRDAYMLELNEWARREVNRISGVHLEQLRFMEGEQWRS